jgi:hypothetical protein
MYSPCFQIIFIVGFLSYVRSFVLFKIVVLLKLRNILIFFSDILTKYMIILIFNKMNCQT